MVRAIEQPKSSACLRSKHLNEALTTVVLFSGVALIFWGINFGTGASPSVPRMLMTVMLPIALLKDYFVYATAKARLGYVAVASTTTAGA